MPLDKNTIVVTHVGKDLQVPQKIAAVLGEYKRTEPMCFRKEVGGKQVGGKLEFKDGYWYLVDKVGTKIAWAEGVKQHREIQVPGEKWSTSGAGFFHMSEDAHISVKPKVIGVLRSKEIGCSEFCSKKLQEVKAKLPAHHRQKLEGMHAKAGQHIPVIKEKANQHLEFAKAKYSEHSPVVKQKTIEGYNACYEWWTHPDTVEAMKTGAQTVAEGIKYCGVGCLALMASGLDMVAGNKSHEGAQQDEEGFVKLEQTNVVPEPSM